jgi:hypothetical protein
MRNYIIILISLFLISCATLGPTVDDIEFRVKNAPLDHPRLFLNSSTDDALRSKIDSDPTLRIAFEHVRTIADDMHDVQPIQQKKEGRRLLYVSRKCLRRVTYLGLAHLLTKSKRYVSRAQEEMLAAAAFSDWNPSHFLDVAEMTAALAIGYDWLYEHLDPKAREIIKMAIIEKGLRRSLKGGWWVTSNSNWNQVCHGGLTLGALAVLEDAPELATQIIKRTLRNIPIAMDVYAPDGAYPEGPCYWRYGTTYNVLMISALESVFGTDFGISESTGFLQSAEYYLHATGPTGLLFNYSDCVSGASVSPVMYWFAAKRKNSELLWREDQKLRLFLSKTHSPEDGSNRMFPFLIIWAQALEKATMPKTKHWHAAGTIPVGMHRSGWQTDREIFVGIKGGSPRANHAHMDIGAFVMDAHSVRWAEDLGYQSYHDLESKDIRWSNTNQDSQRWNVFRLNNFSHNTLVVDGKKQRVNGNAPLIGFSNKGQMPHTIVDMSSVYKDQVAVAKRGVGIWQDRSVLVQDEIKTLNQNTTVRWGMVTRANVTIRDKHTATLRRGDKQLFLSVLAPRDASLELFETAEPPEKHDVPNKGTLMVGFEVTLPPSTECRLLVLLSPGNAKMDQPEFRHLAEW